MRGSCDRCCASTWALLQCRVALTTVPLARSASSPADSHLTPPQCSPHLQSAPSPSASPRRCLLDAPSPCADPRIRRIASILAQLLCSPLLSSLHSPRDVEQLHVRGAAAASAVGHKNKNSCQSQIQGPFGHHVRREHSTADGCAREKPSALAAHSPLCSCSPGSFQRATSISTSASCAATRMQRK